MRDLLGARVRFKVYLAVFVTFDCRSATFAQEHDILASIATTRAYEERHSLGVPMPG